MSAWKIHYSPEGMDERSWDFDEQRLLNSEARLIERLTDRTYAEWWVMCLRGSQECMAALLFVHLRRDKPGLEFDQLDFAVTDLTVEPLPGNPLYDEADEDEAEDDAEGPKDDSTPSTTPSDGTSTGSEVATENLSADFAPII